MIAIGQTAKPRPAGIVPLQPAIGNSFGLDPLLEGAGRNVGVGELVRDLSQTRRFEPIVRVEE